MKKIMFNDEYGLTIAVLKRRKTQTRRTIKCPRTFKGEDVAGFHIYRRHYDQKIVGYPCMYDYDERDFDMGEIYPIYKIGEVVSIAQRYSEMGIEPFPFCEKGWYNKMFVKADLMIHHIKITDIRVERLQDISDKDCLKEGIYEDSGDDDFSPSIFYDFEGNEDEGFDTPREAFAVLIDKVSGKGTWESNPYVFVYDFELVD